MTTGKPAARVGIDNYGLLPLGLDAVQTLRWAAAHGADGVAFSGFAPDVQFGFTADALRTIRDTAGELGLYLEWGGGQHIPRDTTSWTRKELAASNRAVAGQARELGTRIVRSCSGGLMRWRDESPATETLLRETASALSKQRSMLVDHGVVLAIETHFEFTSFELVRLFEMCEAEPGGWLGICLDTMNLLTMLEEPVAATRRLLPWIVSTHIKDGGLLIDEQGFVSFPAPIGQGAIDLAAIIAMLRALERDVHLSIEDHAGSFELPIYDATFLSRFPDLSATEFAQLVAVAAATREVPACAPLPRTDWPMVCEARMSDDIDALRQLASPQEVRP